VIWQEVPGYSIRRGLAMQAPHPSRLSNVKTPFLYECTTERRDGFIDLCLKFDNKAILSALGEVPLLENIVLTLTGRLNDGTPIEGQDCIVFFNKGKRD
jgi:hypothetical protein